MMSTPDNERLSWLQCVSHWLYAGDYSRRAIASQSGENAGTAGQKDGAVEIGGLLALERERGRKLLRGCIGGPDETGK